MYRWLVSFLVAIVSSALAIEINLATDGEYNFWTWVTIGVLTLCASAAYFWLTRLENGAGKDSNSGKSTQSGDVTFKIHGTVQGSVLQAHEIRGPIYMGDRSDCER